MVVDAAPSVDIQALFNRQKAHQYAVGATSAQERARKLKQLEHAVRVTYRDAIYEACFKDLGKGRPETDLSELYSAVSETRHAAAHVRGWMRKKYVSTPLALLGSRSWIRYEPKGVCLLFSPWNLPINLTIGPLASAIAAGNTVIVKPSELTPHCSALLKEMLSNLFTEQEVAVVEGGVEVANELLALPFNHIFFTGSPGVGKIVMSAAAKHLASVTLELGGKSPTIVDETANISLAAQRIVFGKFSNNGQLCLSPDYIYVHESKKSALVSAISQCIDTSFGPSAKDSPFFARFVNERNYDRVKSYLDDAVSKGANILKGGQSDRESKFMEPTLVENPPLDSALMQNEIFGPVLPILTYKHLDEVIGHIQANERPLAIYIYSNRSENIERIAQYTRTGGTCINQNVVHFFQLNLPFGGSNNSGIGRGHGYAGFQAFSNERGYYKQVVPNALDILSPPYNNLKQRILDLTIRWF